MKIGIAGPILTAPLAEFLDQDISKAPRGLGGTNIIPLVKGLLIKGHRVSVYSLDQEVKDPVVLEGDLLTVYYGAYRNKHRMRDFMKVERQAIKNFVVADSPDVVNAHWSYEFALGALASGRPTLISLHDWAPQILRYNPSAYRFGRLLMHFATILRGAHFTANSPYIKKHVQKYVKRDVVVIPNGLDETRFYQGERRLNSCRPMIASANNGFGKIKNVEALLNAFKLIRERIPTARLILMGYDFEKNGRADRWAKQNGLMGGVDFLGPVEHDKVLEIFRSADLLIHSSLEESFGMVLLEAMAMKTPVIGGKDSGAVPWVLDYGRAGVLTDVRSPMFIADEAIRLLTDEERWKMFSVAGYQHARNSFGVSKIVDQYLEAYDGLLKITGTRNGGQ